MGRDIKYKFEEISTCEMCGGDVSCHKVLGMRLNKSQGLRPKKKSGISVSVKKCSSCGLIYASPMPVPFDIQEHYGMPPEEYWIPSYFEWSPSYFAKELDTLKRLMNISPGAKALDIGAGIGKCMLSLRNAGFDTYGFEPSVPFYERAITKMNIPSDRLKLGMIEEVEYENNYFDFITFGAVMEHLYHPAASLQKALKWLKPGGIIQIEVPSSNHLLPKLINLYYKLIGTNYVTNISPMHEPFHLYEFSLRSFEKLSRMLSYQIILYEYTVCKIYFVPKLFQYPFRKYMELTNSGMQLTVWLKKNA
jgi:2-polyprenyl-3-methyl-5-hydroxy-6-metoxy-1,4-benzoquinol methylase